ncbi:hypothetical protein POM88_007646 [Heracleum sosnowskyi]|uniref:Uncharacterized protein n=1 Tax=Heracleum sosnowskyi TaxID=360622 RepID=A0AAD8J784_9APIA|nr:hypothetical protein POM88_007646 [Heracleum sosnowskyi]
MSDTCNVLNIQQWVEMALQHNRKNVTNKIFMIAWAIWKNRNKIVWNQKGKEHEEIVASDLMSSGATTQAVAVTTVKQESPNIFHLAAVASETGRVLWGYPWQLNGGGDGGSKMGDVDAAVRHSNWITGINVIRMDGNFFRGPIPDISNLINIQILHLENNKLTGPLPSYLGSLPSLKELYVGNNSPGYWYIPVTWFVLRVTFCSKPCCSLASKHQTVVPTRINNKLTVKASGIKCAWLLSDDQFEKKIENAPTIFLNIFKIIVLIINVESLPLYQENDDFFELISLKFLSESRYSTSVQASSVRVLFSCSLTWMYPHVFEENVLDNIKGRVLNDPSRSSCEDPNLNTDCGQRKSSDAEMLKTYSTGLLALCLVGGGQIVEDVLTSGLSAKLMRYLHIQTLGETNKKDTNHSMDSKLASAISVRGKDEGKNRIHHVTENFQLDAPRITEGVVGDQVAERDSDISFSMPAYQPWIDGGESPDRLADGDDEYGADAEGCDGRHGQDLREGKAKFGYRTGQGRSIRHEDFDDGGAKDFLRRRVNRGGVRCYEVSTKGPLYSLRNRMQYPKVYYARRWDYNTFIFRWFIFFPVSQVCTTLTPLGMPIGARGTGVGQLHHTKKDHLP